MHRGPSRLLRILCAQALAAALALSASATAHSAGAADSAAPRMTISMDLDAYDATKKLAHLPNAQTIAYLDLGNPAGQPVVLIHGFTDNARDWVPLIPDLDKRFRLIIPDIRGHGRSSKPECCYATADFAYDIKLLLDALGVGRADLVGHSLGSFIAQKFAETWPERTGHVVLIASSGGRKPGVRHAPLKFDYAAQIRSLKEPLDPESPFMISWWSSPTYVDPDFLRRQRVDSANIPLPVWLAVLDQSFPGYEELQQGLTRLVAPTLLIWGSEDPIMEPDVRQTLRAALPHAQVKIFAKLGHNPFWEDPQGVAAVVNAFLRSPL